MTRSRDLILILDFGSQYTQLIARRVREIGVFSEIRAWDISEQEISYASEDLGIVRHLVNGSIWVDGELRKLNLGVMLVWVKEEGGWKILARQAYRRP